MKNNLELSEAYIANIVKELNSLLANYEIFYQNLRGFHWNVKGKEFFVLHSKYEELYNQVAESIDAIAERILTLGAVPAHTYTEFLELADLKETPNVRQGRKTVEITVENLKFLISKKRAIIEYIADTPDEGTKALLTDLLTAEEKVFWMLSTLLDE
ncbi:MAG: DNA starvation/stationary phase protection protein [Bacteroidales bacterium]|nr:DNA starvation/stationary phase protection protein [Bacteroidales bacterium]